MRAPKKGWLVALAALLALAGGVIFNVMRAPSRVLVMPDGSVLRMERIIYGKSESFVPQTSWERVKSKVARVLPRKWGDKLVKPVQTRSGSSFYTTTDGVHTNNPSLILWFTRRTKDGLGFQSVDIDRAELVDEHGCVFTFAQAGGEDRGLLPTRTGRPPAGLGQQTSVNWFSFEAFPRHEGRLRLRLLDKRSTNVVAMVVPNPAPRPKIADWAASPLPITRQFGDTAFVLTNVVTKTNYDPAQPNLWLGLHGWPVEIVPGFDIRVRGQASTGWEVAGMELSDSAGNIAPKYYPFTATFQDASGKYVAKRMDFGPNLCPQEKAWKLAVKFFATVDAEPVPGLSWTLKDLKVPGPGTFLALKQEHNLYGVTVKLATWAGAGGLYFEDGVPISAWVTNSASTFNRRTSAPGGFLTETIYSRSPFLKLTMDGMTPDARVLVWATDEQGRRTYAAESSQPRFANPGATVTTTVDAQGKRTVASEASQSRLVSPDPAVPYITFKKGIGARKPGDTMFLFLDLPADAKTADLTVAVYPSHTEEFVFSPGRVLGK